MPLTPTDVANKQFKIVFRGYSLDEVDGFLDEVESELTRLMRDNNDLRGGAGAPDGTLAPAFTAAPPQPVTDLTKGAAPDGAVEAGGQVAPETTEAARGGTVDDAAAVDVTPEQPVQAAAVPEPVSADPDVQQAVAAGDGGRAALRMLQMAQATAEQAVAEARAEAEELVTRTRTDTTQQVEGARTEAAATLAAARAEADAIVGPARSEAESTLTAARAEADRLRSGAQERAAALDAEIAERTERALGDLQTQRALLEQNIEQLRAFEREYRSRLKAYLEGQLQELGGTGTAQSLETPQLEAQAAELETSDDDRAPQA